jgi:hypothetical protein
LQSITKIKKKNISIFTQSGEIALSSDGDTFSIQINLSVGIEEKRHNKAKVFLKQKYFFFYLSSKNYFAAL